MTYADKQHRAPARLPRLTQVAVAASVVLAGLASTAHAAEIDTGNEDIKLRWDNAVRYAVGVRVEDVNPDFANASGTDSTELAVKRGDLIMNRVDLLSEIDLTYKGRFGARVSASAWNDFNGSDRPNSNPALAAFPSEYIGGEFNSYAKRYTYGPSGEILDAFVFGSFDAGSVPVNVRLGQHVTYWGEGLFNLFHSISYSQAPLNLLKAAGSPGIDAKEVFHPINQISAQAQLTPTLSVAAQYMLDWKEARLPAGGTYYGGGDAGMADRVALAPGFSIPVLANIEPQEKNGQFGVNMRWTPPALGGTVGVYYRKFNEVMPWGLLNGVMMGPQFVPTDLRLSYAQDTELLGLSLSQNIKGVNVGAELSMRQNTALNSGAVALGPIDKAGEGARGDTFHFLVNGIYLLPETPFFRGGALVGELVYSRLDRVTSNANYFNGEGTMQCAFTAQGAAAAAGISEVDRGCVTKDFLGLNLSATFDYPQALPGVNLSIPLSVSAGLKGNAAIPGGGNEGAVSYSVGLNANIFNKHQVQLRYNDQKSRYKNVGTAAMPNNVGGGLNNNRANVTLSYRQSF